MSFLRKLFLVACSAYLNNSQRFKGYPISAKATNNTAVSTSTPTMVSASDTDGQRFALLLQAPSIMGICGSAGPPSGVAMSHASLHHGNDNDDDAAFVADSKSGGSEGGQHDDMSQSVGVPRPRARPPLPIPTAAGNSRRDGTKRLHPDFNFHLQAGGQVVAGDPGNYGNAIDSFTDIDMHDVYDEDNYNNHTGGGQRGFTIGGVPKNTLAITTNGGDKRPSMLTRVVSKGGLGATSHSQHLHQTTPIGVNGVGRQGTVAAAILPLPPPLAHVHASRYDDCDAMTASDENDVAAASSATVNHCCPLPDDDNSSTADMVHVVVGIDKRRCFDSGPPNKRARGAGSSFLRFASPNTISVASALSLLCRAPLAPATADHDDQHHITEQAADS